MKKKIICLVIAGTILTAGAAYAAETVLKRPVDVLSEITGEKVEDLYQQRAAGKTYGQIADDKKVLDEFKTKMAEQRKAIVEQRVKDGIITQEQADAYLKAMNERMEACTGTPQGNGLGKQYGIGFGRGSGNTGRHQGRGYGAGKGPGTGYGMGRGFVQQQ